MRRLAPAAFELQIVAAATIAIGVVRGAGILADGGREDLRGAGLGMAVCVLALWGGWGARTVRTAIRLALPTRPRWALQGTGAIAARVLVAQVAPVSVLALVGGALAADRVQGAPAIGAGALVGVGLTALLAARRVRDAERVMSRRLLREPHWGAPLGRRSLFLEPEALFERPTGPSAAPWPAHRPPPRAQRSAIELDPANPAAHHAAGVRTPRARARLETAATVSAPEEAPRRPEGG